MKNTTVIVIVAAGVVTLLFLMGYRKYFNTNKEGFAQTLGMLEPQRRRYTKCVDNCHRYHHSEFADTYSWTQYLCDRECSIDAEKYRDAGIPDLTSEQFQRNSDTCDLLEASEECYCRQEIKDWCADTICKYSKENNYVCQKDCERVYGYQCTSGLSWSWRP